MPHVIIATNPLDLSAYSRFENVSDVEALLREQLGEWPATGRIYHNIVSQETDVTPHDPESVNKLLSLDGTLWVIVYPGELTTIILAAVAVAALLVAATFLLMPKLNQNNENASPNNGLSNRVNSARPTKRIPEIYGTVLAVPDLIAVPYKKFVNNLEVEIAYMCVGRGAYEIQAVYDGDTPIAQIAGSSVAFYNPYTAPGHGSPFVQIGTAIDDPILTTIKSNEVNGQTLDPPNANAVSGDDDIRFVYPDTIQRSGTDIDFTQYFDSGDTLTVEGPSFSGETGTLAVSQSSRFTKAREIEFQSYNPTTVFSAGQYITITNGGFAGDDGAGGILYVDLSGTYLIASVSATKITLSSPQLVNGDWNTLDDYPNDRTEYKSSTFAVATATAGLNLNGTYTVLSVSTSAITLSNPALVNSAWNNLQDLAGGASDYASPRLSTTATRWVGPFIADLPDGDRLLLNFTADNGLYKVSEKGNERFIQVSLEAEVVPINNNDTPIGPATLYPLTLGIAESGKNPPGTKDPIRVSLPIMPTFTGRAKVRVRRTSDRIDNGGQVIDEVKWRDMYAQAPVTQTDFGNVTTVHSRTFGTSGASSIKERKLTAVVTRLVPSWNGTTFSAPVASNSAADIICAMATDPNVGNRPVSELDLDNIYSTIAEIRDYFGFDEAAEFCYTFDDDNVSFEETIQTVANAVFCNAYRQGSKIKLKFERSTDDSVLLFNHRNKLPGSETRTITFGGMNDYDGVEYEYVDPYDSSTKTIYIPTDRSAINPKKVQSVGQRNEAQATVAAWRTYNKIKYQHTTVEFDATSEADLLIVNDRVRVTDGTRAGSFEGEVEAQAGLVLSLSQPWEPAPGASYTIFLQHTNGTVEGIGASATDDPFEVLLAHAPAYALSLDAENYARATYQIGTDSDTISSVFLLTEKTPGDKLTSKLQAVNYDMRYYQNDKDYS